MSRKLRNLPPHYGKLEENRVIVAKSLEIHLNEKGFSAGWMFISLLWFQNKMITSVIIFTPWWRRVQIDVSTYSKERDLLNGAIITSEGPAYR